IGAVHLVEENPPHLHNLQFALYYGSFNPIFREEFHEYDNVLFLDSDLYAVEGLEESIFDGFDADIGICTEPLQPRLRATTKVGKINKQQSELWAKHVEKKWNIQIPRTKDGLLKIYNSGVVLYSNQGMLNAARDFMPFKEYVEYVLSINGLMNYFAADQEYLQVALHAANTNFVEMDNGWNTLVTLYERNPKRILYDRTENTKLVHIQLRKGELEHHNLTEQQSWMITNLPVEEWGLDCKNVSEQIQQTVI
ncbi:hypothetical protein LCGC14_2102580, partial [marine sediment metagenome]